MATPFAAFAFPLPLDTETVLSFAGQLETLLVPPSPATILFTDSQAFVLEQPHCNTAPSDGGQTVGSSLAMAERLASPLPSCQLHQ